MKSRQGYRTPIPTQTSQKSQTKQLSFKDGVNTYKDNDDLAPTELASAIDGRYLKIGRYKTRKGLDRYSVPIGEAVNVQQTSTTGASTTAISDALAVAKQIVTTGAGRVTRIDVNLKTTTSPVGTVLVELYDNNAGKPGVILGRGSVASSSISSTFSYQPVYIVEAPLLTASQTVWVVVKGQKGATGYAVSSTTNAATGLSSSNGGSTWTAANVDYNVSLYTSTDGGVKGLYRSYRPNGAKLTTFWHGTTGYAVNDGTGATTAFQTGLNGAATNYRAQMVQDVLYYVNGYGYYKYDFTTGSQISSPYTPSLIIEHKGLIFLNDTTDKTKVGFTNFAGYETFTSTDFLYVPAPKGYDGLTAFAKLNGVLYMFAHRNKFQLLGSDNQTFFLDEATDQRGTFSQESVVFDANFIYHADEEGIWQFNGTQAKNLALPFLQEYIDIVDKSSIQLELYHNRLYAFFKPNGSADNSQCYVMNLLLDRYESLDKGTQVGRTFSRYAQDDIYLQASNRVGAVYYGEADSNDYANLGGQLQFEIRTAFGHFDSPGQLKRIPKWRPTFTSVAGAYSIQAAYAKDYATTSELSYDVPLTGSGARYDTHLQYDTGVKYSSGSQSIAPTNLLIGGYFKRIQRRYAHVAAREPVEMDTEILTVETQRLI